MKRGIKGKNKRYTKTKRYKGSIGNVALKDFNLDLYGICVEISNGKTFHT